VDASEYVRWHRKLGYLQFKLADSMRGDTVVLVGCGSRSMSGQFSMTTTRLTRAILTTMLGGALSAACPSLPAQSAANHVFDGTWNVTVACAKAPDGALPYSWYLQADVRRGAMLGHYQKPEFIPSGTLSGQIGADGDALLIMQGLTGEIGHTLGKVNPGTPFRYTITAHFDANHGTGKRNEGRACSLDFAKR
jgi:hypothetical protein